MCSGLRAAGNLLLLLANRYSPLTTINHGKAALHFFVHCFRIGVPAFRSKHHYEFTLRRVRRSVNGSWYDYRQRHHRHVQRFDVFGKSIISSELRVLRHNTE